MGDARTLRAGQEWRHSPEGQGGSVASPGTPISWHAKDAAEAQGISAAQTLCVDAEEDVVAAPQVQGVWSQSYS